VKRAVVFAAVVCAASSSFAQISPIGEFTGALSEGFESFPNYSSGGNYDTFDVMTGQATFAGEPSQTDQLWIYEPGTSASWGLAGNGTAQVRSGAKGLGLYNSAVAVNVRLTFDLVTDRFGGYFATADSVFGNNMTVTFFDSVGAQIGAVQNVSTTGSALVWSGWQSTTAIKSVVFGMNDAPAMDDIQAGVVPEPASLAVIGLGLTALLMRRRTG